MAALAEVTLTSGQIKSAIKNVYIRQLTEIAGMEATAAIPGLPNTMKTPWNPGQFRALATYVVPAPAAAGGAAVAVPGIPAPLPGAIPPAVPAAWGNYSNLDYANVGAVAGANVARDKCRMAVLDCDLRVPADLSILLSALFNGDHVVHGGRLKFRIPTSNDLLLHFVAPFVYKSQGLDITINTPGGAAPTDAMVAAALLPHMLATGVLDATPKMQTNMFISSLGLTAQEKAAFARYDERVEQIKNAM